MPEVQPGIHQISELLGDRYLFMYLLVGDRSLLIDNGIATSPDETILPYLESIGFDPESLDYMIISHADVDHFGGNARMKEVVPQATIACHALDVPWIGHRASILKERYGWFKAFGMGYGPETEAWLDAALGPDVRIDLHLSGGEVFALDDSRSIEILHLPGHSPGHIGFYDATTRSVIVIDAILGKGLYDINGNLILPPPYFQIQPYLDAIDLVMALDFEHFFTAHYPDMRGQEARDFLQLSKDFVSQCHQTVFDIVSNAGRPLRLAEIHHQADQQLGPYSEAFATELAKPVYAHLEQLVSDGRLSRDDAGEQPAWQAN